MDICPHCRKEVMPFELDSCGSRSFIRIECGCGYVGLPIRTG